MNSSTTTNKFNSSSIQSYLNDLKKWQIEINQVDQSIKQNNQLQQQEKELKDRLSESSSKHKRDDPMFDNVTESIKYKDIGNKHFQAQRFKDAVEYYTLAIDLDPSNSVLFSNRAIAYLKINSYQQAEVDCNRSINLDPSNVKAYHRRGLALKEQKKYKEALIDFNIVVSKDTSNKDAKSEIIIVNQLFKQQQQQQKEKELKDDQDLKDKEKEKQLQQKEKEKEFKEKELKEIKPIIIKEEIKKSNDLLPDKQPNNNNSSSTTNSNSNLSNPTSKPLTSTNSLQDRLSRLANMKPTVPKQAPRNSFEFEKVYNSLQNDSALFYSYFQVIDINRLGSLLDDVLSPVILHSIIVLLESHYLVDQKYDNIISILNQLVNMKRASINLQFLSSDEKKILLNVFDQLKKNCKIDQHNQIDQLKLKIIK